MNIQEIRQKYPQYNELSDEQLADGLHKKFYSSLPKEDFFNRIGLKEKPQEAAPVKAPEATPEDQSVFRQFADVPLKVGAGAVTGVRMIADAFGANTDVSKSLRGVEDEIAALYSAQSKNDSKEIARIMKEAEDKGILDQLGAAVKAVSVAPVDLISNSLGTAAPAILAGLATVITGGAPLVATGLTLGTGAIMGAGTIKSAIYDVTKQVLAEKTNMTPEQIEAAAVKAQEYGGKNLDQILIGAAIGAVGARTGVEPVLARQLAKDIIGRTSAEQAATTVATQATGREAAKAAVKAATKEETEKAAERGIIKQGAVTAGKEFATEFPQGAQEQMAQNIAQQREGFDVPTMRGVVSQGALEGLAGFGVGAFGGAREGYTAKREVELDKLTEELKNKLQEKSQEKSEENKQSTETTTPPAGRNLTISEEGQEEQTSAAPTPVAEKSPAIQSAEEYIAKIDSGEVQPNPAKLGAMLKNLGIEVPKGKGFRDKAVQAIREHLAGQGAPTDELQIPQGAKSNQEYYKALEEKNPEFVNWLRLRDYPLSGMDIEVLKDLHKEFKAEKGVPNVAELSQIQVEQALEWLSSPVLSSPPEELLQLNQAEWVILEHLLQTLVQEREHSQLH